ncbi:M15 family metallopeptidase [Hymenobacter sp. BT559]|uniref:M15 family metallopeptidase n=1 Tax=Hymenobacter sp. BT559 TaxID=2795729 RepID=UPI0018ED0ADE|nr:M15 family metallopeptidase [Hymenobacter sp. BT559]MBJ6146388.1 M15 family metallopeptidase [Hymenobacter sp. BT559]
MVQLFRLRVMVALSKAQAATQAARLAQVRPELAKAYSVALARWMGDRKLLLLGLPIVTQGYRSAAEQAALYAQGRETPCRIYRLRKAAGLPDISAAEAGRIVTYKRGGQSNHNHEPSWALDVAHLQVDGSVRWDNAALLLFSRLMRAADKRIAWGGDWDGDGQTADETFHDWPHFELIG